jgi:hypothetical protein
MIVLVAVAIGTDWLYSVYVTFTGGGEVFSRRPPCLPLSCCPATGSKCVPVEVPTRRSTHCSKLVDARSARGQWLGAADGRDDVVDGLAGGGRVGFVVEERLVGGVVGNAVQAVGRQ